MPEERSTGVSWIDQAGLDPTLLALNTEEFLHPWRHRAKWLGERIIDCLANQHGMITPFGMLVPPHLAKPDHSNDS